MSMSMSAIPLVSAACRRIEFVSSASVPVRLSKAMPRQSVSRRWINAARPSPEAVARAMGLSPSQRRSRRVKVERCIFEMMVGCECGNQKESAFRPVAVSVNAFDPRWSDRRAPFGLRAASRPPSRRRRPMETRAPCHLLRNAATTRTKWSLARLHHPFHLEEAVSYPLLDLKPAAFITE